MYSLLYFHFRQFKNRNPHTYWQHFTISLSFHKPEIKHGTWGQLCSCNWGQKVLCLWGCTRLHAVTQTCSLQMTNKASDRLNFMMNLFENRIMSANNSLIPMRELFCLFLSAIERSEVRDTAYWEGCKLDYLSRTVVSLLTYTTLLPSVLITCRVHMIELEECCCSRKTLTS